MNMKWSHGTVLACGTNRVLDGKREPPRKMEESDWNPQESDTSLATSIWNDAQGTGSPLIQSRPKLSLQVTVSVQLESDDQCSSSPRRTRAAYDKASARPSPRRSSSLLALLSPRRKVDREALKSRLASMNAEPPLELPESDVEIALIKTGDKSRQLIYGSGFERCGRAGFGSRVRRRMSNGADSDESNEAVDKSSTADHGLLSKSDATPPVLVDVQRVFSTGPKRSSLNRSTSVRGHTKVSSVLQRSKSTRAIGMSRLIPSSPVKTSPCPAANDSLVGAASRARLKEVPEPDRGNATSSPATTSDASTSKPVDPASHGDSLLTSRVDNRSPPATKHRRHSISYQENCHKDPSVAPMNAKSTQDLLEAYEKIMADCLNNESDEEEELTPSYLPQKHQCLPSKEELLAIPQEARSTQDSSANPTSLADDVCPPPSLERELSLLEPTGWE